MKSVGRLVPWIEAPSQGECGGGSFIGEQLTHKGPYRLWWTSEDISQLSPHPCCFEEYPDFWDPEHGRFNEWCRSRLTDPASGAALLVDRRGTEHADLEQALSHFRSAHRYVSVCPNVLLKEDP